MNAGKFESLQITGATPEKAIEEGLRRLGLSRSEVIIEIIDEGSAGVLGMGSRDATISLTPLREPRERPQAPRPAQTTAADSGTKQESGTESRHEPSAPVNPEDLVSSEEQAKIATETLAEILSLMDIEATVETLPGSGSEVDPPWVLDVQGRDLGVLIGRRGETLNDLQYIVRLIVSREIQQRSNIVVDIEGYKSRREDSLVALAENKAAQAKKLGRTITLEPMPPNERRIIHLTLRPDESVVTESVGMGNRRRVTITPVD